MDDSSRGQKYLIKVAAAVYRATDCFPEEEPLRYLIRERALQILEAVTLLSGEGNPEVLEQERKSGIRIKAMRDIMVLKQYFRLAQIQDWLNPDNYSVLLEEYEKLEDKLVESERMEVGEPSYADEPSEVSTKEKDADGKQESETSATIPASQAGRMGADSGKGGKKKKVDLDEVESKRGKKILKILDENDQAQLRDFKRFFPQVTKRTLRRDLNKLLDKGLVKRTGGGKATFYKLKSSVRLE